MSKRMLIEKEVSICAQCYHSCRAVCYHPDLKGHCADVTWNTIPVWCPLPDYHEKRFLDQCDKCKKFNSLSVQTCSSFIRIEQQCFDAHVNLDDMECEDFEVKG